MGNLEVARRVQDSGLSVLPHGALMRTGNQHGRRILSESAWDRIGRPFVAGVSGETAQTRGSRQSNRGLYVGFVRPELSLSRVVCRGPSETAPRPQLLVLCPTSAMCRRPSPGWANLRGLVR